MYCITDRRLKTKFTLAKYIEMMMMLQCLDHHGADGVGGVHVLEGVLPVVHVAGIGNLYFHLKSQALKGLSRITPYNEKPDVLLLSFLQNVWTNNICFMENKIVTQMFTFKKAHVIHTCCFGFASLKPERPGQVHGSIYQVLSQSSSPFVLVRGNE
jgi:hypothetical protein